MDRFLRTGVQLLASEEAGAAHEGPSLLGLFVYFAFVLIILFVLMAIAKKGFSPRVFKGYLAQRFEQLYLFIENMCVGIIGQHGRHYIPFMMTLWLVIFVSNVVGLFFATTPTADLSFNLAMALISIGYVQYEGMRANGPIKHVLHFSGPRMKGALVLISLVIFCIEIISELMKNVSLTLRLFGNIEGGHKAVEALNELGGGWVPIGAFLLPIKVLTCVVQALIFTLLTCVYLSLVTGHHDDDHGHEGEPSGDHHAQTGHEVHAH